MKHIQFWQQEAAHGETNELFKNKNGRYRPK